MSRLPAGQSNKTFEYDLTTVSKHIVLKESDEAKLVVEGTESGGRQSTFKTLATFRPSSVRKLKETKSVGKEVMLSHKSVSRRHAVLQFDHEGRFASRTRPQHVLPLNSARPLR